jgi:hypothetical protein
MQLSSGINNRVAHETNLEMNDLYLHIAAALLASSLGRQLFWARGAPHASWLLVQATVEAQEGGSTTWRRCHKECCCDHHSSVSYTRLSAVGPGNRESSSRRVHSVASTPARAPLQSPLAGELQGAFWTIHQSHKLQNWSISVSAL